MSNPTPDERIAEGMALINTGSQFGIMSPRELAVILLAVAERAGLNTDEADSSLSGWAAKENEEEAEVIFERLLARLAVS